jgi:prevent-host-death family protein
MKYILHAIGATMNVPAAEFQRNIGLYQDKALSEPIFVTRNGRERTVLISVEEYTRLKRRDRQAVRIEQLSRAEIDAIAGVEMAPEHSHLDAELDR